MGEPGVGYMNTDDGDLRIENGGLVKGYTAPSENRRLLLAVPADYKFSPLTGCGLRRMLGAPQSGADRRQLDRIVREQFTADGQRVIEFKMDEQGNVTLDAER